MRRATVTLPDDLARAVDAYINAHGTPTSLETVMQTALREYLRERGFPTAHHPLKITPKGNSGRSDISEKHDAYLTGLKK